MLLYRRGDWLCETADTGCPMSGPVVFLRSWAFGLLDIVVVKGVTGNCLVPWEMMQQPVNILVACPPPPPAPAQPPSSSSHAAADALEIIGALRLPLSRSNSSRTGPAAAVACPLIFGDMSSAASFHRLVSLQKSRTELESELSTLRSRRAHQARSQSSLRPSKSTGLRSDDTDRPLSCGPMGTGVAAPHAHADAIANGHGASNNNDGGRWIESTAACTRSRFDPSILEDAFAEQRRTQCESPSSNRHSSFSKRSMTFSSLFQQNNASFHTARDSARSTASAQMSWAVTAFGQASKRNRLQRQDSETGIHLARQSSFSDKLGAADEVRLAGRFNSDRIRSEKEFERRKTQWLVGLRHEEKARLGNPVLVLAESKRKRVAEYTRQKIRQEEASLEQLQEELQRLKSM